jgi:beta-lactamase superfamily II metal-dependent hydrolase
MSEPSFTFHNIGQGLFYSGSIENFSCVYDCGSKRVTKLNVAIRQYKELSQSLQLDFLVLSHLHSDHTNGLDELLLKDPKVPVDMAILPYLTPIERLLIALSNRNMKVWYYKFLADPVNFLLTNGVNRILLLDEGENKPDREDNQSNYEPYVEYDDDRHISKKFTLKNSLSLQQKITDQENSLLKTNSDKLLLKTHDGEIYINTKSFGWLFRFYNYPLENKNMQITFENTVKKTFPNSTMQEIIKDSTKRKKLYNLYQKLHNDFNDTSLLMLHKPVNYNNQNQQTSNQGHFLTGDINLNNKVPIISKHFRKEVKDIRYCLVPHHGSKKNWDDTLLSCLPANCNYVISSGFRNKKHPSYEVIEKITNAKHQVVLCHEALGLTDMPLLQKSWVFSL